MIRKTRYDILLNKKGRYIPDRFKFIVGERGSGKTTELVQEIVDEINKGGYCLYVAMSTSSVLHSRNRWEILNRRNVEVISIKEMKQSIIGRNYSLICIDDCDEMLVNPSLHIFLSGIISPV